MSEQERTIGQWLDILSRRSAPRSKIGIGIGRGQFGMPPSSYLALRPRPILVVIQEIEAKGAQLVSIGERFDTTSPMGVAMFQVAGVFAQLERAMIRLRQREGIEAAKKAGRYRGGKKRFDPATIRQMSATGMRPHQIKAELGCSFDTITRALRQDTRLGTAAP